jgi:hypothetical protein
VLPVKITEREENGREENGRKEGKGEKKRDEGRRGDTRREEERNFNEVVYINYIRTREHDASLHLDSQK